jgi:hypothetical protein
VQLLAALEQRHDETVRVWDEERRPKWKLLLFDARRSLRGSRAGGD